MSSMIKTREEIEKGFFSIPFWLVPESDTFLLRGNRFKQLAEQDTSEWGNYLLLLAAVSEAQHHLLSHCQITPLTTKKMDPINAPVLDIHSLHWADSFTILLPLFYEQIKLDLPTKARSTLHMLCHMEVEARNALVKQVLEQDAASRNHEAIIWINAVLQVIWTHSALQLTPIDVPVTEKRSECPCCGSDAVGSVILQNSNMENLRYLHCGLCNSRWNALRAKCTFCSNTKGMSLQSIETVTQGALHGASGECCESCHSYRKMYHLNKEQYADPVADDLASLALDMLLGEAGYTRGGANPFLMIETTQ